MKTAVPPNGQAKKNDLLDPVLIDVHGYYNSDNADMQGEDKTPTRRPYKERADPKIRPAALPHEIL